MLQEKFTGKDRFEHLAIWSMEMKRSAPEFSILVSRTVPATESSEAAVHIEYQLPEGRFRLYARCIICQEFLLGRGLPEEMPVRINNRERLG